ncbi:hypothetical protein ACLB1S_21260 [Escherichia coli]
MKSSRIEHGGRFPSDLTAGRIDAAFQDEVAASEGFLKQPVGKDYQIRWPVCLKMKNCLA